MGIWSETTWAACAADVDGVAAALLTDMQLSDPSTGPRPPVALLGSTTADALTATAAAAWASGAPCAVVDPSAGLGDIAAFVRASGAVCAFVEDQEQYDRLVESGAAEQLRRIVVTDLRGLNDSDDPRLVALADYVADGRARLVADEGILRGSGPADRTATALIVPLPGPEVGMYLSHEHLQDTAERLICGLGLEPGWSYAIAATSPSMVSHYLALAVLPGLPLIAHVPDRGTDPVSAWREATPDMVALDSAGWEQLAGRVTAATGRRTRLVRETVARALRGEAATGTVESVTRFVVRAAIRRRLGLGRARTALVLDGCAAPEVVSLCALLGLPLVELYSPPETGPIAVRRLGSDEDFTILPPTDRHPRTVRSVDGRIEVSGASLFSGYLAGGAAAGPVTCPDRGEVVGDSLRLAPMPDPTFPNEHSPNEVAR
ncbi:MAG: hypothetical protein ABS81_10945 [Pseudonocardia sp. SCN 72-86]|nr:MAG: hypothetical protein ABS81_10945 [Pseudonocardia sp. SCN 72-86]